MVKECLSCGKPRGKWEINRYNRQKAFCSSRCAKDFRKTLYDDERQKIFARDHYRCRYCGSFADCIDHVVPVVCGGKTIQKNLVSCCRQCNTIARDSLFKSFRDKKKWILRQWEKRGIPESDTRGRHFLPMPAQNSIKESPYVVDRNDWHTWVYGGIKKPR